MDFSKLENIIFAGVSGAVALLLLISIIIVVAKGKRKCGGGDVCLRIFSSLVLVASAVLLTCSIMTGLTGAFRIELGESAVMVIGGSSFNLPLVPLFKALSASLGQELMVALLLLSLVALICDCLIANKKTDKKKPEQKKAETKTPEQLKREREIEKIRRLANAAVEKTSTAASSETRAEGAEIPAQKSEPAEPTQEEPFDWRVDNTPKKAEFSGIHETDESDTFDSFDSPFDEEGEASFGDACGCFDEEESTAEPAEEFSENTAIEEIEEEPVDELIEEYVEEEEPTEEEFTEEPVEEEPAEFADEQAEEPVDDFEEPTEEPADEVEEEPVADEPAEEFDELAEEEPVEEEDETVDGKAWYELGDVNDEPDEQLDEQVEQAEELAQEPTDELSEEPEEESDYENIDEEYAAPSERFDDYSYVNRDIYIPGIRTITRTKPEPKKAEAQKSAVKAPAKKPAAKSASTASKKPAAKKPAPKKQTNTTRKPPAKPTRTAPSPQREQKPAQREQKSNKNLPVTRRYVIIDRRSAVNIFSQYLKDRDAEEKQKLESSISTIIIK